MAKKRKQLVNEIITTHDAMRVVLVRAGISETRIKRPVDKMEKKEFNDVRKLRTWLNNIFQNEYAQALKIWKLLPEEHWKRYIEMEVYDMAEQCLLREANRKLDAAWGHKPKRKKGAKRRSRKKTNSVS